MACSLGKRVPLFERKNPDAALWLSRFESFGRAANLKPEHLIKEFPTCLSQEVYAWFDTLPAATQSDWQQTKEVFLERFQKKRSKWEYLEEFNSRQHEGEDIEDFIQDLELIAGGAGKSQQDVFEQAVLGMTNNMKEFVLSKEPKSMTDLIKWGRLARTCNKTLPTTKEHQQDTVGIVKAVIMDMMKATNADIADLKRNQQAVNELARHRDGVRQSENTQPRPWFQKREPQRGGQRPAQRRYPCPRCGKFDHSFDRCRHSNTICHNCNVKGHIRAMCTKAYKQ